MASIAQRKTNDGKTHYRVLVRLKGHPAQSATFERLTDAKKWASKTETDIREGRYFRYSEAKRHTVGEMIDRYTKDVLPGKNEQFRAARTYQLKFWRVEIGSYSLADATPAIISEARDKLARTKARGDRERSAASVNRHLAAL